MIIDKSNGSLEEIQPFAKENLPENFEEILSRLKSYSDKRYIVNL